MNAVIEIGGANETVCLLTKRYRKRPLRGQRDCAARRRAQHTSPPTPERRFINDDAAGRSDIGTARGLQRTPPYSRDACALPAHQLVEKARIQPRRNSGKSLVRGQRERSPPGHLCECLVSEPVSLEHALKKRTLLIGQGTAESLKFLAELIKCSRSNLKGTSNRAIATSSHGSRSILPGKPSATAPTGRIRSPGYRRSTCRLIIHLVAPCTSHRAIFDLRRSRAYQAARRGAACSCVRHRRHWFRREAFRENSIAAKLL